MAIKLLPAIKMDARERKILNDNAKEIIESHAPIYVQSETPSLSGPGVWFQTGLPNGGFTLWVNEG